MFLCFKDGAMLFGNISLCCIWLKYQGTQIADKLS